MSDGVPVAPGDLSNSYECSLLLKIRLNFLRVSTEEGALMSEESVRITKGKQACFHMLSP